MWRRKPAGPDSWMVTAVAAGAAAGAGAIAFAVLRGVRIVRQRQQRVWTELDLLEDQAVEVLRRDSVTGSCAIDIAAIGPRTVELTGVVPTHDAAQRAARLLHALPGVNTVISRLEIGSFEARLADNRERLARGEPSTTQRRWYGVRVGTGRRRQSLETEPARPDDAVERRTRQLEVQSGDVEGVGGAGDGASPHGFDASQPPL
jgi:hypothetical protein